MSGMDDTTQPSSSMSEDPERRDFFQRLYSLHEQLGTPIRRQPMVSGRLVDLFDFHKYVQGQGGYKKITESRKWTYTARTLYPDLTYNHMLRAGYLLRNYYLKLLQPYDDNFGPEAELKKQIHSSFNSPLALRRNSLNTPFSLSLKAPISMPVAMTTTTQSQSLPGLWKRVEPEPTGLPLHKLLASLESGYPNEVDFAMNMLLLISHQGDIEIDKHPKLLEMLTAHVGIPSSDSQLCKLYQSWYVERPVGVDHAAFWREMVPHRGHLGTALLPCGESSEVSTPSSIFHSKFRMGSRLCEETYRVVQVLTILLNFSFQEDLVPFLVGSDDVLRLLTLASNSFSPELSTLAADTLGNLAKEVVLNHEERYRLSVELVDTVHFMVTSQDHHKIVRGLEILEGLTENDGNVPFLLDLPVNTCQVIFNALLLGDLQLLCASLECLIGLSDHSDLCAVLLRVNRAVDTLLSLLTFDSSSLDYASLEELAVYQQTSASQPGGPATVPQTPPTVTGPASSAAVTKPQQLQVGGAVKRGGSVLPSPLATNSFAAPKSNQNPLLLNSDLIAKAWLQSCYEETLGEKSSWSEMCTLYNAYCAKLGNIGAMSSTEFLTVLRTVYPMAVLTKLAVGKDVLVMVVGLRKRSPLSNPILLLSQEAAKMATKWTTPLHHSSAKPSHLRPSSPTIASAALPVSLIPSPLFSPHAKQATTSAAASTAAPTAMATTVSAPPPQPIAVSTPRTHINATLTPLARSFQAKPTFVNITDYTQPSKTAPVSTSSVTPSSATSSKEREQVACAQNEGEEERKEGGGTARDSAVQGTSVLVTGSEPREAGPTSSERNGSENLLGEGVDGNMLPRAAQVAGHTRAITPTTPLDTAVRTEGNGARNDITPQTPVNSIPTDNYQTNPEETRQLGSENSLPLKSSTSHDNTDDPPLLLMNGSATESEVAKCRNLSSTSLIMRKRPGDGVPNVGGALFEGVACVRAEDGPPPKQPRCSLEGKNPVPSEPIGDEDIEVESKTSETSNKDVSILVPEEADVSEEGDIEVVEDKEDKNMKEFLQSEEGIKWLEENPDKKVCKWDECYSVHSSLERHLYLEHGCEEGGVTCKWAGCPDQVVRRGPSLMMHLRECHLSCREEAGEHGRSGAPAIHRVLARLREMDPFQMHDEDVLTKSIRFSAALVLRNLSRNCPEARSVLKGYESRLVETALSESDASTIIANCLHFIAQDDHS